MRSLKSILTQSITEETNANHEASNPERRITSIKKLPRPVYYIESPNDSTVLVGINVTIHHDKMGEEDISIISWYDTSRERVMTASETRQNDDRFAFKRIAPEGGGNYYFTPMNLNIYNAKVKQHLAAGADFTNDIDLIKAFLSTTEDGV